MPRYQTPSPSPPPSSSRTKTTHRTRSRSRFSDGSSASRGERRRALTRSSRRSSSDDSDSDRSRSTSRYRRDDQSRSRDSSRNTPRSRSKDKNRNTEKKDKIPIGFLAGIGVSAYLLHKYWPKGWVHGDHGYWDRIGRDRRDKVEDAIRDRRDRAESSLKDKGEAIMNRVGPAYEGFRDGYVREGERQRGGERAPRPERSRDRDRQREWEWERGYDEGYREAGRRRRSFGDEDPRSRRPAVPRSYGRSHDRYHDGRPPPDMVNDHVYDIPPPPPPSQRARYGAADDYYYEGQRGRRIPDSQRY